MSKSLKVLIVIVLILSVFFRFVNVDQKVYSADEVRSILRLSGYTSQEFMEQVFTGDLITAETIQKYQTIQSDRNLNDAIHALASNPEHPPLYHLSTRFWMQLFNQPISARIASIIFSLLVFPSLYWLCLELFESPLVGLIAITIVGLSPIQIHAAQNTTQYSLWTVAILLSSAALMRALRLNNKPSWLIYTITLVMGFYTHLFYTVVAFGHGVYVLIIERFRLTKHLINYLLASLGGFLIFLPWLLMLISDSERSQRNTQYYGLFKPSFAEVIQRFFYNLGNVFLDFHNTTRLEKYLDYLIFILIAYSLYFLFRHTKIKVWLLIVNLILGIFLVLVISNFISPSARPLQARYYLPTFLGFQLTVSYLIASQINSPYLKIWQQRFWQIVFVSLLSLGVISGMFISQINDWGLDDQKGTASGNNLAIAPIINQAKNPVVISDTSHSFILALSYLVKPDTKFQLFKDDDQKQWENKLNLNQLNQEFSEIFLYFPRNDQFVTFIDSNPGFKRETLIEGKLEQIQKN